MLFQLYKNYIKKWKDFHLFEGVFTPTNAEFLLFKYCSSVIFDTIYILFKKKEFSQHNIINNDIIHQNWLFSTISLLGQREDALIKINILMTNIIHTLLKKKHFLKALFLLNSFLHKLIQY